MGCSVWLGTKGTCKKQECGLTGKCVEVRKGVIFNLVAIRMLKEMQRRVVVLMVVVVALQGE